MLEISIAYDFRLKSLCREQIPSEMLEQTLFGGLAPPDILREFIETW